MRTIRCLCFATLLLTAFVINAQTATLKGQLIANDEVEGLHILNKTASKYAISTSDGSFMIPANVLDTLVISGVKYQVQEFVISASIMELGRFSIQLIEKVNELNEVVVGKILTGRLESDLANSDVKPEINFYDLGIPGYKGKPLTQNERKLHDANSGPTGSVMGGPYGAGVGLNVHKILNKISGRTKKLEAIVALDDSERCMQRLKQDYERVIFENDTLAQSVREEYFLFCQEDAQFLSLCNENNDIKLLDYLQSQLKVYKEIRNSVSKD